jgi:hypothetical protein
MRVKFRRAALVANIVLVGSTLPVVLLPVATPNSGAALPLYQFVNSGTGPLPWNAVSFESAIDNTKMLGSPHAVSQVGEAALTYRMANSQIGLYVANATGASTWTNVSTLVDTPTPASDPIPFFDPMGLLDILYVSTSNHLILLSTNSARAPRTDKIGEPAPWHPWISTDLTLETGVGVATGLPSVHVSGFNGFIAFRSLTDAAEVIPLNWILGQRVPSLSSGAVNVSSVTSVGPISNDPVALPETEGAFAATTAAGSLEVFANTGTTTSTWSAQNLTSLTSASASVGALAVASTAVTTYVAALNASGGVELYATPDSTFPPLIAAAHAAAPAPSTWTAVGVTASATGAPPLDGTIYMNASPTQLSIAGQATNWGDLFVLTSTIGTTTWSATDVSATGGTSARTVGPGVTGMTIGSTLDLFAAGVSSPPPQGVGLYAIPSKDWGTAITNGWPIISGTGGLGTRSAPWVGFTSTTNVVTSPDFLMGQSIYNAHKRVTWLSFWTVSGPLANEQQTPATYYSHGFAAGAWVATQIDQYRSLGVGLKPDWVIFDPEGYPDNHSGLDAPGGSSQATMALYATHWTSMLSGWSSGISSVDPSLKAGVYASQSEYRNYGLVNQAMPVFMAVAFAQGGPVPVAGASGSNVRGFIAFDASCTPTSTLKSQESTLKSPPWSGQFNTLQFNAGVYCPPA